jgi:hypothetical protein
MPLPQGLENLSLGHLVGDHRRPGIGPTPLEVVVVCRRGARDGSRAEVVEEVLPHWRIALAAVLVMADPFRTSISAASADLLQQFRGRGEIVSPILLRLVVQVGMIEVQHGGPAGGIETLGNPVVDQQPNSPLFTSMTFGTSRTST